jgi:hypothetical protein
LALCSEVAVSLRQPATCLTRGLPGQLETETLMSAGSRDALDVRI